MPQRVIFGYWNIETNEHLILKHLYIFRIYIYRLLEYKPSADIKVKGIKDTKKKLCENAAKMKKWKKWKDVLINQLKLRNF